MVPHPDQSGLAPGSPPLRHDPARHRRGPRVERRAAHRHRRRRRCRSPSTTVRPSASAPSRRSRRSRAAPSPTSSRGRRRRAPQSRSDRRRRVRARSLALVFDSADLAGALDRLGSQHLTRGSTRRHRRSLRAHRLRARTRVKFPADSAVHERVLMPRAPCESRGMEDVRMVRFVGPTGPRSTWAPTPPTTDVTSRSSSCARPTSAPSTRPRSAGRAPATRGWPSSPDWWAAATPPCPARTGRTTPSRRRQTSCTGSIPSGSKTPTRAVGDRAAGQLRATHRDRTRVAGAHSRRRADAHLQHRRRCSSTSTTRRV